MGGVFRVIAACACALSLVSSGVASAADAPSHGTSGKAPALSVKGDDIGPAVYHPSNQLVSPDKGAAVNNKSGNVSPMSAGQRLAANSIDRYSWTGLWCYSLGITGYYHSTGTTIDYYGGTYSSASANGWGLWQVQSQTPSWAYQQPTAGIAGASGVFTHGIPTPWGSIALQTVTDFVSASATP